MPVPSIDVGVRVWQDKDAIALRGYKSRVAKMKTDGIMAVTRGVKATSYPGEWPSGKATDFECVSLPDNGRKMLISRPRIVNGVTWAFAPDWLTVSQACELSGYDRGFMLQVIEVDGVDLDNSGRIEKRSLWEWLEVSAEIDHWDD